MVTIVVMRSIGITMAIIVIITMDTIMEDRITGELKA